MKETELRIGNWYNSIRFNTPIKLHLEDFAEASKHADGADSLEWFDTHIDPIPITDQWFKDLGFEKKKAKWGIMDDTVAVWANHSFCITIWDNGYLMYEYNGGNIRIEYVHQLQNIYSALNKTELTKQLKA